MTWQNRRAWHVSLASMLYYYYYYCNDHYHGNTFLWVQLGNYSQQMLASSTVAMTTILMANQILMFRYI